MINKRSYLIIAVIVSVIAITGIGIYKLTTGDKKVRETENNDSTQITDSMVDKNSAEYKTFVSYIGEDYDRYFIAGMIEHHKGAVDMAKLVQTNAKHQELKDMSYDIISAQTKEISDMEKWQIQWGYPASSGAMMIDHSAMGMTAGMSQMTESLKGLSGDAFDTAFLASMIEHHQSAINMAYPGQTNAKHDEIKTLTGAIVNAQSREINQMKQWQQQWGY